MRRVDRSQVAEPAVLKAPYGKEGLTELQRVIAHRHELEKGVKDKDGKPLKAYEFDRYKTAAVKDALEQLFHGKCAYCESPYAGLHPVDVEHFRPKGEVDGVSGHPGYWWLAMEWTNLLPSCIDCNRRRNQITPAPRDGQLVILQKDGGFNRSRSILSGKQSVFPLMGGAHISDPGPKYDVDVETEQRLLIDPARDDPDSHLVFHVDRNHLVSLVHPRPTDPGQTAAVPHPDDDPSAIAAAAAAEKVSLMGAMSIQIYGLNRLGLVQARSRLLVDLEFLLKLGLELRQDAQELQDRADARGHQLDALNGAAKDQMQADIDIDRRISARLAGHAEDIRARIHDLARPEAPYSRLVRAWIEACMAD